MITFRSNRYDKYEGTSGTSVKPGTKLDAIRAVEIAVDMLGERRVFDIINDVINKLTASTKLDAIADVEVAIDMLGERVLDGINEFTKAKFDASSIGDDFDLRDINKSDMRELAVHLKKSLLREPFYNFFSSRTRVRDAAIIAVLPFVIDNIYHRSLAETLVNTVLTNPEVMGGVNTSEVINSIVDNSVKSKLKTTLQLYVELCNSILEGKIDVSDLDSKDRDFKSQFKHILNLLRKLEV